ncbi:sensor histidine kinase [Neobacillus drentensis]|uniref:sensor histidine kinase n=1 Tax=Neobacillus drentensis TaxID=220684 RepID=UPI00285A1D6F|nr:ATP-binding protein [Neobacillus drentensis]MDR7239075.1 signal transduction histidine kinase [Neobacillus drentensis]
MLIPTGGISSPFIWYALNPVLVAASFLTSLFCWGALTFYLSSATIIAYQFYQIDKIGMIVEGNSYFYLVCLLTTLLVRLFSGLTKELKTKSLLLREQQDELVEVNKNLTDTNQKYQQILEHVMALYHLMENFNSNKNPKMLAKEITTSLMKCTQSEDAFFWLTDLNHQNGYMENVTNNEKLELEIMKKWNNIRVKRGTFTCNIGNVSYLMKTIRSSNHVGVIGVKVSNVHDEKNPFLLKRPFEYLAELSEIMLERIHLDQMMDQMLIIEEQNRIANEIHDSVSQRLFGIVCALHSLQVKGLDLTMEELNQEYRFLSQSANTTLKELRSAIYRLSSVKKGEKPFLVRLKKYLDEYAELNEIKINYQIIGDETSITERLKQALYRIICEACGNAVRHGECSVINLHLSLLEEKIELVIQDDGVGIHSTIDANKKEKGIGLLNMKNIVGSFAGTISIDGIPGVGTGIQIGIPKLKIQETQEVSGNEGCYC